MLYCLVRGVLESVDDADVWHPGDKKRYIEVDETSDENVGVVRTNWVTYHRPTAKTANICVNQQRAVESHVVDPYVDDNRHSDAGFESRSTDFLQSQKSTEQTYDH